jgi:hypothetical protein
VAAGARRWGCAREAGIGRGGAGEGWHGSGILGVLYIGRGDEVRGRERKSGGVSGRGWKCSGRQWELSRRLLMVPFRVGEEMGEGEIEGEGRGWGGSLILGGVEGRGR